MALRLFQCAGCGHRMRLFGARCGYCQEPKELHQRGGLYVTLTLAVVALAAFGLVAAAGGAG